VDYFVLKVQSSFGYFEETDNNATLYKDVVGLGTAASQLPKLSEQLVFGLVGKDYFMGRFGLFLARASYADPATDTWLMAYNKTGKLSSCSYGYTAGANHRKFTYLNS
jgi:hypothetical protein